MCSRELIRSVKCKWSGRLRRELFQKKGWIIMFNISENELCKTDAMSQPIDWQNVSNSVWQQAWLDCAKANNKMVVNQQEADLALRKEFVKSQLAEEREINRELSEKALVESSDGALCMEYIRPDGTVKVSQPISSVRKIRSCRYISANRMPNARLCEVLKITWCENEDGVSVVLDGENIVQKVMHRLRDRGVALKIPRRLQRELYNYFVGLLLENAVIVKIPEHLGWNQLSDGAWIFESDPKRTLRGMNDYGRN